MKETERPKKQEVKDVKGVEKNALESQRGHQNRQIQRKEREREKEKTEVLR